MAHYLFSPGPVMAEEPVRQALLHYDICHRSPEFEALYARIRSKAPKVFGADESYCSLVVSGSGTAVNEACLSSVFRPGEKALVLSNGEFGGRLVEILNKYGVPATVLDFGWGVYPDLDRVESALRDDPGLAWICMVFHETSTGMINPARELGELARRYGRRLFADCVSAAGGEYIDAAKNHIDLCTTVASKCLGAFPGASLVCGREDLIASLDPEQGKSVYLNLAKHYRMAKTCGQTPNTPNVTLFWALDAALDWTLERETLDGRIARYRECAGILRTGMRALGLSLLLPKEHMSNTVTSVFLPEGRKVAAFIADMERDGFTVYPGKGEYLERNMFQVANMGAIYPEDCERFLDTLKKHV